MFFLCGPMLLYAEMVPVKLLFEELNEVAFVPLAVAHKRLRAALR